MSVFHFIYFDVGGVLMLDYSGTNKWIEMKRDLGVSQEQDEAFDRIWKKHRERICVDCDVDTILPELERELQRRFSQQYSMLDDFVHRFEQNTSIWPIVTKASEQYRLGLLTNMYPRMLQKIQAAHLIPDFSWHAIVDSSTVGFQKPDPKIFEVAEQMAECSPKDLLFVDNSEENVETAKSRGWQGFLYDPQYAEESSKNLREVLGI